MALGALPGQVGHLVVTEAFGIVAAGLAIGVPAAIAAAIAARAILAGVLFELSPVDPGILIGSAVAILLIASLAAILPARRAARIDPLAAVKYE
jgi:ABC-type antimicrobial peptide transport system permease subunit